MRLDGAVFVVAPQKAASPAPTRRAFLLTGGAFVVGAGLGGACGYSLGVAGRGAATEEPTPSGDDQLDELRRLAIKAPLHELIDKRLEFVVGMTGRYQDDAILWRGIDRLVDAVLADPTFPDRRRSAGFIAQFIDRTAAGDIRTNLQQRLGQLRKIR